MKQYNFKEIESKWQNYWIEKRVNELDLDNAEKPFYNLMMFPYPSAEGLHVGGMYAFTGVDTYGRFMRTSGYDVFEPIGLDAFGIHSENYALKIGEHIKTVSQRTEKNFYRQLKMMGNMFSWERTVETNKKDYYSWTQWLFIQFFKSGLAYRKKSAVNYCPGCKTVLSDEQVINNKCERCSSEVLMKDLEQWFFKITKYAEQLNENLKKINWDEEVKTGQKNWIGKKSGIDIKYPVKGLTNEEIVCFTTRPDTNFGATFVVLAPEHEFVDKIINGVIPCDPIIKENLKNYVEEVSNKTEIERISEARKKTGIFTGFYVINRINNREMPLWVSDFVLGNFGTGAVVGVPGHDERDFEFAKEYNIASKKVIDFDNEEHILVKKNFVKDGLNDKLDANGIYHKDFNENYGIVAPQEKIDLALNLVKKYFIDSNAYAVIDGKYKGKLSKSGIEEMIQDDWSYKFSYTGSGKMVNSDFLNGLSTEEAIKKIIDYIESKGWGKRILNYNLRDWCISRQRYWGPPIPMIHCENCAKNNLSWFNTNNDAEKNLSKEQINELSEQMKGWYPEENLPVELPEIESLEAIKPDGSGKGPLAMHNNFMNVKCPYCGADAKRETDVSDPFVDSCWYFLRYPFTEYNSIPFGGDFSNPKSLYKPEIKPEDQGKAIKRMKKWGPVNSYIGGKEHTVLHLLYARFITMVFKDLGYIDYDEPFSFFYGHGLITKDGTKMSKSKGNVVNPDEYIEKFGADSIRLYLRFLGPFDTAGDWRDSGMEGMFRYVKRLWKIFTENLEFTGGDSLSAVPDEIMHKTIKSVTEDLSLLKFNTAVARLMEFTNWFEDNKDKMPKSQRNDLLKKFNLLLAPFVPHLAEEFWSMYGNNSSIFYAKWPEYDSSKLISTIIEIPVQINGRVRDKLTIDINEEELGIIKKAQDLPNIQKYLLNKTVKKTIYIKGKILNIIC